MFSGQTMVTMVLGTYLEPTFEIGSVTAKIFLTCTYVTRTNVFWSNVPVTIGNFSLSSQEPTFKVWSKLCKNQLNYCLQNFLVVGGWWVVGE